MRCDAHDAPLSAGRRAYPVVIRGVGLFRCRMLSAPGSSSCRRRKNPDVLELIRAKTGRVYGHLVGLLTIAQRSPVAYIGILQEDKEAVFDAVDTTQACLEVAAELIKGIQVNKRGWNRRRMAGFLLANRSGDYLVTKDCLFRQAHQTVGRIVVLS